MGVVTITMTVAEQAAIVAALRAISAAESDRPPHLRRQYITFLRDLAQRILAEEAEG